jgi:two-component sensor histidine kinase
MAQAQDMEFPKEAPLIVPEMSAASTDNVLAHKALGITVGLSFLLLLAAALLVFQISRQTADADLAVSHTLKVKQALSELFGMVTTAESGQRGYLLTRDQRLLDPYREIRRDFDSKMRALESLVADNLQQSTRISELTPLLIERLGAIEQTLSFAEAGQHARAASVVLGRGVPLMSDVRRRFAELDAAEDALLLARQAHAAEARGQFLGAVSALLVACGILAMFALVSVRRYFRSIELSRQHLGAYNTELEHRVRDRTEELRCAAEVAERERLRAETLLTDVNHRVGNNLALVSSFLTMQQRVAKSPEAARALGAARARVQAIASAHRKLRLGADFASVKACDVLGAVLDDISAGLPPGEPIKIEQHIEPLEIAARDAVTLGVLTSELVMNAVKHAFVPAVGGQIKIVLSAGDGAVPYLEVSDDGVGWHEKNTRETGGLGTRIVEMVARQYGGTPERRTSHLGAERPGTCIRIQLDKLQVLR